MATTDEINVLLAANAAKRTKLAATISSQQDAAKQAYNIAEFFNPEGKKYSSSFTGSLNGQTFTDPYALHTAAVADFQAKADLRKQTAIEYNALFPVKTSLEEQLKTATDLAATVKTPEVTNTDATAAATTKKYATQNEPISTSFSDARNEAAGVYAVPPPAASFSDARFEANRVTPAAAMPRKKVWANVVVKDAIGNVQGVDLRVKIRVPTNYLTNSTSGINKELSKLGGIIFPYTPSINYEHKADYANATPTHSNFTVYFYKSSSIGSIAITGKFTVQNDADAGVYLATIHLLRALTKMRSGGITGDADSGAPPPVCRLDAYGDAMLANVPVAITNFRLELPDNIDYYNLGPEAAAIYGQASVPTLSTVTLSCIPMYSRQEMQDYSVTDWLNNPQVRKYGLL